MKINWLVLGGSARAPRALQRIDLAGMRTITTNAGIHLLPMPTIYYLGEQESVAFDLYAEPARIAQSRGTILIGNGHLMDEYAKWDLKPDSWIMPPLAWLDPPTTTPWVRGTYCNARFSGLICLMHACNQPADEIHLVGMDGYRTRPGHMAADTWTNACGTPKSDGEQFTQNWIGPMTRRIVEACADVKFVFYGWPHYRDWINGLANVQVIDHEPADADGKSACADA